MSDEYDRQRDIEAEGQRAAAYYAEKDLLPQRRGANRLLGVSPEGRQVDNVTEANRYDVDPKKPWIPVNLLSEDRSRLIAQVFMPNTRERPDVLQYKNDVYEVITTLTDPPQYRQVMALRAVRIPPT
jgi:hypothetical protein